MIRLLPITLLLEISSVKISVSNLFTTGIEICDPKDCETKNPPGKRSRGCPSAVSGSGNASETKENSDFGSHESLALVVKDGKMMATTRVQMREKIDGNNK